MFCAFLGHTGERLQDHWSSGFNIKCIVVSDVAMMLLVPAKSVNIQLLTIVLLNMT